MSEIYEGIIVRGEEAVVIDALDTARSPLDLLLIKFGERLFGTYPRFDRSRTLHAEAMAAVAERMSSRLGAALLTIYDNRCGVRVAILFDRDGVREFGKDDELWAPLNEDGTIENVTMPLRTSEPEADREYEHVVSAIDAGLAAMGVDDVISAAALKEAFCYERFGTAVNENH